MSCHKNFHYWLSTSPRLSSGRHDKRSQEATFQLQPCTTEGDDYEIQTLANTGDGNDSNDGTRVKFVMSKKQLRKILAYMGSHNGNQRQGGLCSASPSLQQPTLEKFMHVLRGRRTKRVDSMKGRRRSWAPSLQSIPEEI